MATRLYVGNLPYNITESDVQDRFQEAGRVVACELILDTFTSRSRGFAFVDMGSQEEAHKAVQMFNGTDFQGRPMVVNEARPRS
ncbi:MAG: RNA-binding protein [Kiritimatiellae bacterium]|nr:RNA-binding protein [Kiritimatiellia bacterium]